VLEQIEVIELSCVGSLLSSANVRENSDASRVQTFHDGAVEQHSLRARAPIDIDADREHGGQGVFRCVHSCQYQSA
jgi:hypothetical protein